MSPLLFIVYINDLCDDINSTELGLSIGEEKVSMLNVRGRFSTVGRERPSFSEFIRRSV